MNKIIGSYLETEVEKQDVICINPPWKTLGVKFIDKSVNDLKDGGKLVCVMDYNKFTRSKTGIGEFHNLMKRGYFRFIKMQSSRDKIGYFSGIADSIYFVFVKGDKPKGYKTTIINRIYNEFQIELKGNEQYPPMIPNESDYFDWDDGIKFASNGAGWGVTFHEDRFIFAARSTFEKTKIMINDGKTEKVFAGCNVPLHLVHEDKMMKFLEENHRVFWDNYTVSHGWNRLPPFKKDLDIFKEVK